MMAFYDNINIYSIKRLNGIRFNQIYWYTESYVKSGIIFFLSFVLNYV